MIAFGTRAIYLCSQATDMRKGFNGLSQEVLSRLGRDPRNGDVFVFIGRTRTLLKALCYEDGGFWLFCRRLGTGRFSFPVVSTTEGRPTAVSLTPAEWQMLLEGVLLRGRTVQPGRAGNLQSTT
jgi:transposase